MKMFSKTLFTFVLVITFMTAQTQGIRSSESTPGATPSNSQQNNQSTGHSGNYAPGTDIIGFGYDIFGEYASQRSLKSYRLFQYSNFSDQLIGNRHYSVPRGVIFQQMSEHIVNTVSGESVREYAKNLATSVGLEFEGLVFSGSVETNVGISSEGSTSNLFFTYMDSNTKWKISLDTRSINNLKAMLDPQFKHDIDRMDPALLFETYGTHYVASAFLGGRIDYTAVSNLSTNTTRNNIEVALTAKYKAVSGSSNFNQTHEQTLSNANTRTKLRVTGGNSQFANNIEDPNTYERWAEGIESMPVLCGFERGSLRPVWEFASTENRKRALEMAFEELLKRHPLPVELADVGAMSRKFYHVRSQDNGMYMDLKGFNYLAETAGGKITLHEKDRKGSNGQMEGADRFIKLIIVDGNVIFQPQHSELVFEVVGGAKTPGTQVQLAANRNRTEQMFKLIKAEARNTFLIKSVHNDLYLTAKGRGPLTLEAQSDAANQLWIFEEANPYTTMAPPNVNVSFAIENVMAKKYLDMPGRGGAAVKKTAKIQLWSMDHDVDRYFTFAEAADAFVIQSAHNNMLVLDNEQGRDGRNGSHIHMWDRHNGPSQLFTFEWAGAPATYKIKSRVNNKYIDASKSNIARDGCKVHLWDSHKDDNQVWRLHVKR